MLRWIATFFGCIFRWRVKPSSATELKTGQVVIALSFGCLEGGPGGKSNEALAVITRSIASAYHLPAIAQWEIADSILGFPKEYKVRKHHVEGKYLDSYEVLLQAHLRCNSMAWFKAIILAHPDHLWRCVKIAERLGFEVLTIGTGCVPYDPKSTQWWTRGKFRFILREIPARFLYLLKGWI